MNTYFRTGVVTLLLGFSLTACHEAKKSDTSAESTASERKLDFQSDDEFLTYIQKAHFNYMWEGAEPTSGLACERIHTDGVYPENDADIVTTGGSGFGIAGLLVGIERGFITREEGVARFHQIADYLAKADRFHGVWPHWMHGPTGKVKPFGQKDNGGDLVESAFLMQGLLCVRQYFKDGNESEKALAAKIDQLWREMEWTWYLNGQDVLYWHWSPNYAWEMNFPLEGYNECLITYILAASSLWKGLGWGTLIYMSALGSISDELYDACTIDGGGRFRQAITVTLPGVMNVIMLQLILDISSIMGDNYEQIIAMTRGLDILHSTTNVVGTLAYGSVLGGSGFSLATACGLIQGVIGLILVIFTNRIVKKTDNEGIL